VAVSRIGRKSTTKCTDFRKLEARGQGGFQCDNVYTKFHEISQFLQNLKRERHRHIHKERNYYLCFILDFIYRQTQQCTNPLTHISMCIAECIGDTILLHVSVHRTIFRQ
jgi:hypothetical protein